MVIVFTRALLCIQGVFIATIAWAALATLQPGAPRGANTVAALLGTAVAVAGVLTAVLMRQRQKWAAVSAIAIEGLWTVVAVWSVALPSGPSRWGYLLGAALPLIALIGLSLKPVRSYFGLIHEPETIEKLS